MKKARPNFESKQEIQENYRRHFSAFGDSAEALQLSKEGQLFRFQKLIKVASLTNATILDLGCGLCHFYEFLSSQVGNNFSYTGIDITDELIAFSKKKYPELDLHTLDIFESEISRR